MKTVKDILKKEHGVVKNGADSQKIKEISQNHVYFLLAMFKMKQTFTKSLHNEKNGLKSPQLEKDIHKSDIFDCNSIKLELCFTLKKWKCWTRISIYYYRFLSWVKFICDVLCSKVLNHKFCFSIPLAPIFMKCYQVSFCFHSIKWSDRSHHIAQLNSNNLRLFLMLKFIIRSIDTKSYSFKLFTHERDS